MNTIRSCGECSACCTVLAVTGEGINKPFGVTCDKLGCFGCSIYETKPAICSSYQCIWTLHDKMPEWARPDRLGILINMNDPESHFSKLSGVITFSAHETRPFALSTYWSQKLIKMLSKRWVIALLSHGVMKADSSTEFVGPGKDIHKVNEYNKRVFGMRKSDKASNLPENGT